MNRPPDDRPPFDPPPVDVDGVRAAAKRHEAERLARAPTANASGPDPGRVLVSITRHDRTELRVSLHFYEGKPFVRVAPWQSSDGKTWWPVKGKGATVKVRELARVASALVNALDAAADDNPASGDHR